MLLVIVLNQSTTILCDDCELPPNVSYSKNTHNQKTMISSVTPFSTVIAGLPEFIRENNADWKMATDYILTKVSSLTVSEWSIVGKIYDDTTMGNSN